MLWHFLSAVFKINFFFLGVVRERMVRESNEKTGTFISARQSPKRVKTSEKPNKWMRTQVKKINFREPSIRARQSTIKLHERPIASKRNQPRLPSRDETNTGVKQLTASDVQSPPMLDYRKIVDALQYAAVAEKCILLEALRWVCNVQQSNFFFHLNLRSFIICSF